MRGNDFEIEAGLARDAIEKLGAVGGAAAGFGGHLTRGRDAAPVHLLGAALERIDGAVHGLFGEAPGGRDPFPEARNAGEGIDDPELRSGGTGVAGTSMRRPVRFGAGHEHAAVIGAEVERGKNAVLGSAVLKAALLNAG